MYNNHTLQKQNGFQDYFITAFCYGITLIMVLSIILGFRPVYVSGNSMAPTYHTGTICVAREFGAGAPLPERGDIVIFRPDADSDTLLVKRLVGLPGDTLLAENDALIINGKYYDTIPGTGDWIADVPDGYVFCLGDNRGDSYDSRNFGCIPIDQLTAKILFSPLFSRYSASQAYIIN